MSSSLVQTPAWQALSAHANATASLHMRDLFAEDPDRTQRFTISAAQWLLDYSKNRITTETVDLLLALARQAGLQQWQARMFDGEIINHTEQRAVLHTALRNRSARTIEVQGQDVMPAIHAVQQRMAKFSDAVREGQWLGHSGKRISDVVNIGIGGSDLGPFMICEALQPYAHPELKVHFVSNIDGAHIDRVLQSCRADQTLFIVSSKSFSTQETLNNTKAARAWYLAQGGPEGSIGRHFVAVTSNNKLATEFGISSEAQFDMWDWVGGRYSLWSAIGLPIAISIGMTGFQSLLQGAFEMDEHFRNAPFAENIPVMLALMGIWNSNFLGLPSHAVLPYAQQLASLHSYLQQADMESNGKSVDRDGLAVDYQTGPVIWGGTGTNAQHAFFQLMHQGTQSIPADFILFKQTHTELKEQQQMLLANGVAQMEALMRGKTEQQVRDELAARGVDAAESRRLAPYMAFAGNHPSNALLADALTPQSLGALIAMYEHKIFVQGVIWNINSYDQYGVEYGKQMAKTVLQSLNGDTGNEGAVSGSTQSLIRRLR